VERITATTHVPNDGARRLLERLDGRYERDVSAYGTEMALYTFSSR